MSHSTANQERALRSGARRVAITGAAGYIGKQLLLRLLADPSIEHVLAIDIRSPGIANPKLTTIQQDILQPLGEVFARAEVDTLVHLAFVLRQSRKPGASTRVNLGGARNVLTACEYACVPRILLMSSATIYGAHADNKVPLTEDAPVRPPLSFTYARDKAETERLFNEYALAHAECTTSMLRGCVVMGPSANNFITAALFKPLLIGIRGCDPPMQFVHEDDLVHILHRFVVEDHPGIFNLGPPDTLCWSELIALAEKRLLWLPAWFAYHLTNLTWSLRIQNDAPGVGLNFIRWPWVVDSSKLQRELDYEFEYTSREAIASFVRSAQHS